MDQQRAALAAPAARGMASRSGLVALEWICTARPIECACPCCSLFSSFREMLTFDDASTCWLSEALDGVEARVAQGRPRHLV